MSNAFDKLSVLDSFIEEVNSYLPEIEANLERLTQSLGDIEALEETYRRAHTIGGSASMMDFPGLSHVAHGMEDILGDVLDGLATLDPPTLGLLQRSLGRMYRLLQGIRSGIDEDAVIAEDDADYAQYHTLADTPAQSEQLSEDAGSWDEQQSQVTAPMPLLAESSMPSLDEVLASFRAPAVAEGEEMAWPEEPVSQVELQVDSNQNVPLETQALSEAESQQPSALEMLVATTRKQHSLLEDESELSKPIARDAELEISKGPFSQVYRDMRREARALEVQAASLKQMLTQLRSAISVIEAQRTEFKGFLDGSKDALDRMEDWAGQAMGLNLRNSPEQVRRYLPLSVMWVANSKLKKVLDRFSPITSGVEMTSEQMHLVLQQLHTSIESCGEAFRQLQASSSSPILTHDPGWTAWEVQVSREAEAMRERVTFERRGDPAALHAEIEAKVREELRREYETRPLTLAVRAELEQQIRNEVRQEFEAKRQLHERVSGSEDDESRQELKNRLRNEIEIQVRQEFLNQITAAGGDAPSLSAQSLMPPVPSAPLISNFVDKARAATGMIEVATAGSVPTQQPRPFVASTPLAPPQPAVPEAPALALPLAQPTTPLASSSMPAFSGDIGEEAAEIFRLEAEEHLQTISMYVAALEKSPANRDLLQGIRRATHTLKGAAGMMGFRAIADLCHISEDLLENVMEEATPISPSVLSIILDTAETLDLLINDRDIKQSDNGASVQGLRARYVELLGEQSTTLGSVEEELDAELDTNDEAIMGTSSVTGVVAGERPMETNAQRAARGDLSVRVRLQKLDELVSLFGELLVNRSILEERVQRLIRLVADVGISSTRLRDVGQKLESRFEAATLPSGRSLQVMPGEGNQHTFVSNGNKNAKNRLEPGHLAEFDELELDRYTEFHQLARGLSEGISDMTTLSTEMEEAIRDCEGIFSRESRLNTTFQDRLMKTRLVPLLTMAPRLYRAARAVALKQHKEFEFLLEGEETEVDRTVYEEIAGPLLHLMRNAVNHAIETPEVRREKGKPPAGQIKLSAAYEGNQVVITIRDDGIGIDPVHVTNAAIARGLIREDQVLNDNDLIDLIFRPGFSTAEFLSEESGRGVGLDVVRDSVSRLRGSLEVESMPGQGTAFTMKFPTSLAIQSAVMIVVGGQQFAIPTVMVESIGRLDTFKRSTLGGRPAVVMQNALYPLNMLKQYLGLPTLGELDEKAPLLLVNAGGRRVALAVDDIKGKMDVVMKNLGPHLRDVHGIAGGTVLGNGRVVLILELLDLLSPRPIMRGSAAVSPTSARREGAVSTLQAMARPIVEPSSGQQNPISPTVPAPVPERGKHILVVDDSPSVRRVVSNMLKQHGWEVQMARDGVEALDMITYEPPAAVLLDIEMPRMDGYELMATVRSQEQYRTLPIVILTSRAAVKHQQHAMQLGASAYVVKPYQDEELINTLNTLVYGAAAR